MSEKRISQGTNLKPLQEACVKALGGGIVSVLRKGDIDQTIFLTEEFLEYRAGVFVLLLREKENPPRLEVLLVQRRDHEGLWNLPGGGIEEEKPFADEAIREVKEETGLDVKLVRGTTMSSHAGPIDKTSEIAGEQRHDRYLGIIGVIMGGELKLNEEAAAIQWFPVKDLPEKIYLKHKSLIHGYFSSYRFKEMKLKIFFAARNHHFIPEGISA